MSCMKKPLPSSDGTFHVGDAYIWAQIYYLDSCTDYREHVPTNGPLQGSALQEPMVLLDEIPPHSFWTAFGRFIFAQVVRWFTHA